MSDALREAVRSLQMPPEDARAWLLRVRAFCGEHGGEPRYGRLLALIAQVEDQLDQERR